MTISVVARWVMKLVPDRHRRAAAAAEHDATNARLSVHEAAKSGALVDNITERMALDRQRNHYADRFAAALGRDHA